MQGEGGSSHYPAVWGIFGRMTLIKERRRDGDVIAGFCVLIFALAAWRGSSGAPVLAVIMGLLALGTVAGWAYWRRRPPSELTITPSEVTLGPPGRAVRTIPKAADPLALTRSAARQTSWYLAPRQDAGGASIPLIGFDAGTVRDACVEQGWEFRAD